jgi:NADH:ubiquinone oxidoreductase subunit C
MEKAALVEAIKASFPELTPVESGGLPEFKVSAEAFRPLMERLRSDPSFAFDYPMDMTAVDWPDAGVITCVYHLYSLTHGHKLVVKLDALRSAPHAPTVADLWPACDWFEREVYDLFGVVFDRHPDLRRILLTDDWVGFPLRKDYRDSRIAGKTN